MTRLSDLTPAAWTPVAERVPAGAVDAWSWHLAPCETAVFREALDAGNVLTAQRRRTTDGCFELVARRRAAPRAERADAAGDAGRERMARGGCP